MSQSRDESLRQFAAEKVMGWRREEGAQRWRATRWVAPDGALFNLSWNPLDSWADAGQLIETTRKRGAYAAITARKLKEQADADGYEENNMEWLVQYATPRAITEAICRAYGWKEPESPTPERESREGE